MTKHAVLKHKVLKSELPKRAVLKHAVQKHEILKHYVPKHIVSKYEIPKHEKLKHEMPVVLKHEVLFKISAQMYSADLAKSRKDEAYDLCLSLFQVVDAKIDD